ncbi:NifB/NifX family molybdenum-iron cluster-binding protein [Candidatus Woesearchaeota archaeon]|nr:NifB/NifX family molybdenum-iron cluster-binding protein [Candidatus Woesearchaeota archaeon]
MKIAISATGKDLDSQVDVRFGRCPYFIIVDIEGKKIKGSKAIENTATAQAGGAGISAAEIIGNQKVDAVITGNLGPRAFDVLSQLDVEIYQATGTVKDVIDKFLKKELTRIDEPTGPQHRGMGGKFQ